MQMSHPLINRLPAYKHRIKPHRAVMTAAKGGQQKSKPGKFASQSSDLDGVYEWHDEANSRAPRFYISDATLLPTTEGSFYRLEGGEAQHALKALRLRPGDRVELAGEATLCTIDHPTNPYQ